MNIPFYQAEWFGLELKEISKELKRPLSKIADEKVYHLVYQRLLAQKKYFLSPEWIKWIEKKHTLSNWLLNYFHENNLNKSSILSVGCGLGIVEQPLIKSGLKIDLQECQNLSIQYLQKTYPKEFSKTNFIVSNDLKEIPDNSYDMVVAITSTYCLTDEILGKFLTAVHRILKENGTFIWYETALTMGDIKYYLRTLTSNPETKGLLWGWKRSRRGLIKMAHKNNLRLQDSYWFDSCNNIVNAPTIFGISINKDVTWQMVVLKK